MKILSIISLVVSVISLVVAGVSYHCAQEWAVAAVHERELALVRHYEPVFRRLYMDFRTTLPERSQNPQTIEDLLDPAMQLVEPVMDSTTRPVVGGG